MASSLRFLEGRPVSPVRAALFHGVFATCGIMLFAVTRKLWTPQTVFPQVPLVRLAGEIPKGVEWTALVLVVVSLAACMLIAARRLLPRRAAEPSEVTAASLSQAIALWTFAAATGLLIAIDQHRLQPWAFQFVVIAIVLAVMPARRAFALLRWLTISIYFWSAIAKIDHEFLHTQGPQFVDAFAGMLGFSGGDLSPTTRLVGSWMFPLAELLVAVGLCLPLYRHKGLRRSVLAVVVTMHLLLIAALSPLGLNHAWGVMVWNFWFIAQALLLFSESASIAPVNTVAEQRQAPLAREMCEVVVELLVAAVILLPVLTLFGRCDHWLGWGLYAPRNSRVTLYISPGDADWLGTLYDPYISRVDDNWAEVRLGEWSLGELAAPVYPQDRFQLGVAAAVVREHDLQNHFQIIMESSPDRFTGRRRRQVITDAEELERVQRRFLINSHARPP